MKQVANSLRSLIFVIGLLFSISSLADPAYPQFAGRVSTIKVSDSAIYTRIPAVDNGCPQQTQFVIRNTRTDFKTIKSLLSIALVHQKPVIITIQGCDLNQGKVVGIQLK